MMTESRRIRLIGHEKRIFLVLVPEETDLSRPCLRENERPGPVPTGAEKNSRNSCPRNYKRKGSGKPEENLAQEDVPIPRSMSTSIARSGKRRGEGVVGLDLYGPYSDVSFLTHEKLALVSKELRALLRETKLALII